ncbi:hypothetical protein HNP38_000096 [Chryseobacterium defluvii]|uniref:eCIS core domain-containing protein n=1 Tax=Chryseobacterium defluvii TaxID=160396 RepID=A0A840KAH5_9FLAO|nr:DUF4157 domain-containing protein [Chryseobacterium defluvii]MBB4804824.1 hypothetical protein [Chryseobacterium defluvii]
MLHQSQYRNSSSEHKNTAMFFKPVIQKKLSVGSASDSYEVEADRVADQVMKMPESSSQVTHTGALLQRKCAACEEEEKVQMKPLSESITPFIQRSSSESGGIAPDHVESGINSGRGSGNSMDTGTKNFMENRFGADFSQVKIHTGSEAVHMSRELGAQAFTVGNDIYFNEGKYSPGSHHGKHLLAHELTHTIQQGGGIERKVQRITDEDLYFRAIESEPEPETTVAGVCGPDITTELSSEISRYRSAYSALSATQKTEVCDSLSSYDLGEVTWDIEELHNNAWIYQNYRPQCATAGAQPPCGSTVQVDNQCFYAGSVNYVIFGVMCKECGMWKSTMNTLIWLYKSSSANYTKSSEWANVGYDGWTPGSNTPTGDRNNCTPTCSVPFAGPTFHTRICPHIDPSGVCPSPSR